MWQKMGRQRRMAISVAMLIGGITLIGADWSESTAEAKFLKNGVRTGDRSAMTIRRRPAAGARKRIFHPGDRPASKSATIGGVKTARGSYAWFWKIHSAAANDGGPQRFVEALKTMAGRRAAGKALTGAATLGQIAETYRDEIAAAARTHRISEALILAVIAVESRGSARAVSSKGAQGLMQLIPATARRFGVTDTFDPRQNIDGGAAYLSWLLKAFGGDTLLALAGYNAGEGAVHKHDGVPPFAETRDYVVLVLDALTAAQKLCATPIVTPRQRCRPVPAAG